MSTNYLAQFSANLSTISAVNINYSTLVGSTIIASSIITNSTINVSSITSRIINYSTLSGSTLIAESVNYSTLRGSTMTVNTLVIASTLTVSTLIATNNPAGVITSSMISLGASTNQSYTVMAQGNFSTSTNWVSTLNNLSSMTFVAMSGNAQTQLAITQMNSVSSVYFTSTLGTSWSTISNVTGLPTATQTNYTCGAVSGNGQYAALGTSNGNLYITSTLTSATGPSFTTAPVASFIYLPFENSVADVYGNSIVTITGTPLYVPGIVGSYAINLANTLSGTASRYIRGTWSVSPNISISGWFRATTTSTGSQYGVMFTAYSGNLSLYLDGPTGQLIFQFPSGSGSTLTQIRTSYAIAASTWYSFFAIFQTNGVCSLYLNNVLIGTATNTGGYGSLVSSGYFGLGTYDSGDPLLAYNGYIDDFRIYTYTSTYNNVAISNSGQYMLATILNGGLFMSSNFGSTWSQVSTALLKATWSLLEVSSTGQYMSVYAQPVTVQPQLATIPSSGTNITTSSWQAGGVTWIATASSVLTVNHPLSGAFNTVYSEGVGNTWASNNGYSASGVYIGNISTNVINIGAVTGEYIQLQSSVPLVMYSYALATGGIANINTFKNYTIVGSNDGSTWYPIQTCTQSSTSNPYTGYTLCNIIIVNKPGTQIMQSSVTISVNTYSTSINSYSYFRIIFQNAYNPSNTLIEIGEWFINFTAGGELYSTNYGTTWGNSYPANTSKLALSGSGQYSLENINTTTVTTTPQLSGLASAIVGTWNVSGVVWTASTSSYSAAAQYYPTNAFSTNIDDSWSSGGAPYTPTYPNSGTNTVTIGVGTIYGEYLQLQNSVPLVMNSYTFMSGAFGITQMPRIYYIVGSNDGNNWYPIQYVVSIVNPTTATKQAFITYFNVSYTGIQTITAGRVGSYYTTSYPTSGNAYTYFRMITRTTWHTTTSNVEIGKWYINFNNIFMQPQLTGLTGATSGNTVTSWISNNVTWTSSASSVYVNSLQPWTAFNNVSAVTGNYSWASASNYNGSGVYNNTYSTTISAPYSAAYTGEWLQVQSSVPVVLYNYSFVCGDPNNFLKTYFIVGSNDGTTWFPIQLVSMASNPFGTTSFKFATSYLLANYTGSQILTSAAVPAGVTVTTTSYSTSSNAYTYFRIISNSVFANTVAELGEWFINFSNTLTSPQLTGLSTASWILNNIAWNASSSTNFNNGYPAYGAFDNATPGTTWVSATNYTNATPAVATGVTSTTVITSSSTTVNGEWLQLQSSTPLQMYSYTFVSTDPGQFPNTYTIAGSNDGTTWYLIQSVTMNQNPNTVNFQLGTYIIANQSGAQTYTTSTRSATFTCTTSAHSRNSYRYFRIIAPTIWVASISFGLGEWFINFTTTTVSPQLSGLTGNTSSSTPVPTTWPANNITWTCDASSVYNNSFQPWRGFNNVITSDGNAWTSLEKYSGGVYNNSVSTTISAPYSAPYLGEWLQIQSSVPVVMYNYTFGCRGAATIPKAYLIAGSNDGTTWYPIQLASIASTPFGSTDFRAATSYLLANYTGSQTLTSAAVPAGVTVTTTSYSTSSNAYMYFRIISNLSFGPYIEIGEWFLNFTPTQYITSNYLSPTSSTPYIAPIFSPALTSTNAPITSVASQTGQYIVLITNNTSGANVYYSTNYGANFTGLTIGSSTMVSCAISLDGSCITVSNATTVYQLNNNSIGYSVAVGNQAGQQNQYQNSIAIGSYAGQQNQTANSIVLNATGTALNTYGLGFYVSPIAQYGASTSSSFNLLGYGSDNQIVQTAAITIFPTESNPIIQTNCSLAILGNVGIGTTNPQYQLDVSGTIRNSVQMFSDNSAQITATPALDYNTFGQNWTTISYFSNVGLWTVAAISASGQYQTVAGAAIGLHYSTNYGQSWTASTGTIVSASVYSIVMSASGQYQIASAYGIISYSNNYGAVWAQASETAGISWQDLCMSASGQYASACGGSGIYYSTNYGVTWIISNLVKGSYQAIACSASGQYQVAVIAYNGSIYYSTNYGVSWTGSNIANAGDIRLYSAASMSASGQYATIVTNANGAFITSNYGVTWNQITSIIGSLNMQSVAVSASGQYQVATGSSAIYYSTNYGTTWIQGMTSPYSVLGVAISANGQYCIACFYPGGVYQSITRSPSMSVSGPINVTGNINLTGSVQYNGVSITTGTGSIWNAGGGGVAYYNGGNVSIGTATPYSRLSIHGPYIASGMYPAPILTWSTDNGGSSWQLGSITGYVAAGAGGGPGGTAGFPGGLAFATKLGDNSPTSLLITRMVLDANGYLGIGNTTPSNLLTVGASVGPAANSVGITNLVVNGNINCNRNRLIFSNALADWNHCIYNNGNNLDGESAWDGMKFNVYNGAWFRVGNAGGVVPITAMFINTSGNVGIGTTIPGYSLDVGSLGATGGILIRNGSGNSAIGTSAYPQIIMGYNGTSSNAHWIATRHNGGAGAGNAIDFYLWTSGQSGSTLGSTLMMSVTSLGVGIGTTSPSFPLTVYGSGGGYAPGGNNPYISSPNIYINNTTGYGLVTGWFRYDLIAGGAIGTFSDIRIKNNIKPATNLLDKINQITIVSHGFIDPLKTPMKTSIAVIAQDIVNVIPDAVSFNKEVIPNIMQVPVSCTLHNNTVAITCINSMDIIVNNKIQLILKSSNKDCIVSYISDDKRTIHVPAWDNINLDEDQVFVYGKYVDDFHIIDKQKLGLLALGGVKELYQMIKEQQNQINQLTQRLAAAGIV